jgi:hypothetical protein
VLFQHGAIAQIIVKRQAGVIDEDIERFDSLDSALNLRSVGYVKGQGRNAPIQVGQGLARTGIHPLRASAQGFLDQRLSNTAIGPGDDDILIFEAHQFCSCVHM